MLRISNARHPRPRTEDVGCDFTKDGWRYVWGHGKFAGQAIGPVEDCAAVARALAAVLEAHQAGRGGHTD